VQREALRIIASKISRMCSCDPEYADNWHDIAGYATLVEGRCQAKEPAKTRWPNPSPPEFSEGVERSLRQQAALREAERQRLEIAYAETLNAGTSINYTPLAPSEENAKPLGEGGSFIGTAAGMYAQDAELPGNVRPLPPWSLQTPSWEVRDAKLYELPSEK